MNNNVNNYILTQTGDEVQTLLNTVTTHSEAIAELQEGKQDALEFATEQDIIDQFSTDATSSSEEGAATTEE